VDMITAARTPRPVTIGGTRYLVAPRTFQEWGQEIQGWILANVPGPIERVQSQVRHARANGVAVSAADEQRLMELAVDRPWPPPPGTAEWVQAMGHPGADEAFLWFALRRDNPGLTREDVAGLAERVEPHEVHAVIRLAYGKVPKDDGPAEVGGHDAPKPPAPTNGAKSSGPSPRRRAGHTR
jgi:hypothetical protein